jgi:hypothetical protein
VNLYAYAYNDPVNYVDRTGRSPVAAAGALEGGAGAAVLAGGGVALGVGCLLDEGCRDAVGGGIKKLDDAASGMCLAAAGLIWSLTEGTTDAPGFPSAGDPDFRPYKNSIFREAPADCCRRLCGGSYPSSPTLPGSPKGWPSAPNPDRAGCESRCMASVAQ